MAWYELKLERDGDSWMVTAPAFEEVVTYGDDREHARHWGGEAILQAIAGRIADHEDIPAPLTDATAEGEFVEIPAMVVLKAGLYMNLRAQGKTRADLVRMLGWHREQVDRLFRLDHQSKLDAMEAAFKALGMPLKMDVPFPRAA
jgi:antitoxin HicB